MSKCPKCSGLLRQSVGKTHAEAKYNTENWQCIMCAEYWNIDEILKREKQIEERRKNAKKSR